MNLIRADELTKVYAVGGRRGSILALDNVSLSVEPGEIFGLLGPNGAGKTTFLKVLLGITPATAGSVTLFGLPPSNPESRQKIGYLPENHRFPSHLTGGSLLVLAGRMCGLSDAVIAQRMEYLLKLVDMTKWEQTKIRKYSKGMMQRIGLAQALINDPDLLFLDEPTDGVDPVGKAEIKKLLVRLREEGKSIVLNSHLLSEVESVADRVAILSRGKLVRIGTVGELTLKTSQYEIEADFGHKLIEIPEEIGKKLSLTTSRLIVDLNDPQRINDLIDQIRIKKIPIFAVRPIRISLEQSFMETISLGEEVPQ